MGMVYVIPHSCVQVLCDHFLDTLLDPDGKAGFVPSSPSEKHGVRVFSGV